MLTARTGACGADLSAEDRLGAIGKELLETVGGSDFCSGMGREIAPDWFSRFIDGCSTRKFPRGLGISVFEVTAGRKSVEGTEGLGG